MNEYKILIVEDEKQIARFLQLELMHEGYEVETVYDGREGFKKIKNNEYNLIILDVMLPSLNGMEVCRRVRAFSEVPIIMLTAKDSVIDKVTGLDIGADDYMTKPFAIEELLARIRAVKRKNSSKNNENKNEIMVNDLVMNLSTHEVRRGDKLIELTKREYDLLEYLMKNVDVVLNREQLLEVVWGYNYMGDTNVVDVYIRYLRSKIDEEFDVKLIHTVRGVGYVIKKHKNID